MGHTQYEAHRDICSGSINRQYSVSCWNCCNCGSYGSWQEDGCKNDQVKYVRYNDCGNADILHTNFSSMMEERASRDPSLENLRILKRLS